MNVPETKEATRCSPNPNQEGFVRKLKQTVTAVLCKVCNRKLNLNKHKEDQGDIYSADSTAATHSITV